jgi:hypothetical protein
MAEGSALKKDDLFESGAFEEAKKGASEFLRIITDTQTQIKENISAQREFVATFQAKSFADIQKVNTELEKTNVLLKANEKLSIDRIKVEQQTVKLLAEEEKLLQQKNKTEQANLKTQQEKIKLDNASEKALKNLNGEYRQGVARLAEIKKQLKELAFVGRDGGKVYKALSNEFKELDAKVRKAEEGVGEFQRNVGNYRSGFNGLGNSINQLTREFPAFTNSVQTGFLALSNNLPIFFDEISKVQKEIKALRAEGQQVPGLFKQLATNILSVGTALSLGVTLLTMYGAKLIDFVSKIVTGKDEIKAINEALQDSYIESVKIYEKNIDLYLKLAVAQGRLTEAEADNIRLSNDVKKQRLEAEKRFAKARIKLAEDLGVSLEVLNGKLEEQTIGKGRREGEIIQLDRNKKLNEAFRKLEEQKNKELAAIDRQFQTEKEINRLAENEKEKKEREKVIDDSLKDEKKFQEEYQKLLIKGEEDKFKQKRLEIENTFRIANEELAVAKVTEETRNKVFIELKKVYLKDLYDLRQEQLAELQKELDEAAKLELETEAKLEKERLKIALENQKKFDKAKKQAEDKNKEEAKKEIELKKEVQRELFNIGNAIEAAQQARSNRNIDRINREEDRNKTAIEKQEELAQKGLENTLAFERAKTVQLDLERKKQQEKDQRNQKILAFYRLFASYADKDPQTALARAALDISLSELVAGSFIEGTENVGRDLQGNKVHNGTDGYVVAVDGDERIFNPSQNAKIGDITNDEAANILADYQSGKLFNYGMINQPKLIIKESTTDKYFKELNQTMIEVKKAILNKPVPSYSKDIQGNLIETIQSGRTTKRIIHKR